MADYIILLIASIIIALTGILARKVYDAFHTQVKANTRVEQMYHETWTGHPETRLYACNVVYQKLGGIQMNSYHRRAYHHLIQKVLTNQNQTNQRNLRNLRNQRSQNHKPLTLIQKPL